VGQPRHPRAVRLPVHRRRTDRIGTQGARLGRGHRPHPRALFNIYPRQRLPARPTPALKRIGAPGVTEVSTSSAHISMREAHAHSRSLGLASDRRKGFPIFRVGNQIEYSRRPGWLTG
jgi:hypothetical protein